MDQIAEIRRQKMLEYKMNVWLPQITEKYGKIFHPKRVAGIKITKFCKKHLLIPVINITEDEVCCIPGIFRMRLKFTNNNKNKPISHIIKENVPNIVKNNNSYDQMNEYISKHYEENQDMLYGENHNDMDNSLKLAIQKSLSTFNNVDEDVDINEILYKSRKDHELKEDEILAKILEESVINQIDSYDYIPDEVFNDFVSIENDVDDELKTALELSINEESFFVCIDIRVYGPEPYLPIYVNGNEYYLNNDQINKVKKIWNMVNPYTNNGLKYSQNLEYQKSLSKDLQLF